jgi:hypothetical protein
VLSDYHFVDRGCVIYNAICLLHDFLKATKASHISKGVV